MKKRIITTTQNTGRIKTTGSTTIKIDPEEVRVALGAEYAEKPLLPKAVKLNNEKRFFNSNGSWSDDDRKCDDEISLVLEPLFNKYIKLGYTVRDIANFIAITAWSESIRLIVTMRPKTKP